MANLTESIEEKIEASRGSKKTTLPSKKSRETHRFVVREYKFISTKDYRNFFNSLSPLEVGYLESPIPTDVHPEADGSIVISFKLPP